MLHFSQTIRFDSSPMWTVYESVFDCVHLDNGFNQHSLDQWLVRSDVPGACRAVAQECTLEVFLGNQVRIVIVSPAPVYIASQINITKLAFQYSSRKDIYNDDVGLLSI